MPRRTIVGLEEVADLENLALAFWRAAKGKRNRPEVHAFEARLASELEALRTQILDLSVPVGRLRAFEIRDPKRRTIHAPCFRERVLHHALMAKIGPILDRALVDDTFACRDGKGSLAAVLRAQEHARRFPWYVQVDMRSFFASIDHEVLKRILRRRIKGAGTLALCDKIIDSYEAAPGHGLPIGALSSQHFANTYLSDLDRYLLEDLCAAAMVRYMDDVVWWVHEKADGLAGLKAVESFVRERLRLELKPERPIQRSLRGLSFCGFRIYPGALLVSRRRRRRYVRARQKWETAHALGVIDSRGLQAGYASALAITAHADAAAWRRKELRRHPAVDV